MGRAAKNYPRELKDRAMAMVREVRPDYPSEYAAIEAVAAKLGIGQGSGVFPACGGLIRYAADDAEAHGL